MQLLLELCKKRGWCRDCGEACCRAGQARRSKQNPAPEFKLGARVPQMMRLVFVLNLLGDALMAMARFEIISADYIVTNSEDVYLLEFNTGALAFESLEGVGSSGIGHTS